MPNVTADPQPALAAFVDDDVDKVRWLFCYRMSTRDAFRTGDDGSRKDFTIFDVPPQLSRLIV